MPRKPRQFTRGGIYHIVNRGIEQRRIFLKNQDYSRFILALEFFNTTSSANLWELIAKKEKIDTIAARLEKQRAKKHKSIIELMAFTLMPNHFHLIIRETIKNGISLFMRKMGGYSSYFNKQYDRIGSLLASRYKAIEIQDEIQLNNVFVYVHTNPIELIEPKWKDLKVRNFQKAIEWLENYKWSSYRDYIGKLNFPTATKRDFFLNFYNKENGCREVVEEWIKVKARNAELGSEIIE